MQPGRNAGQQAAGGESSENSWKIENYQGVPLLPLVAISRNPALAGTSCCINAVTMPLGRGGERLVAVA